MPLINIPVGIAPCQIDDFPKTVGKGEDAKPFERSCKGALYLRPASTKVLTQHELDWIKNHGDHKMLARRLVEVRVDVVTDESNRPTAKATEAQVAKAEAKAKMQTEGKAAPMTGKRAEAAIKAATAFKSKAPVESKTMESEPAAESSSSSDSESSSKRSRRRSGS